MAELIVVDGCHQDASRDSLRRVQSATRRSWIGFQCQNKCFCGSLKRQMMLPKDHGLDRHWTSHIARWYNLVESTSQTLKLSHPRLLMLIRPNDAQPIVKPRCSVWHRTLKLNTYCAMSSHHQRLCWRVLWLRTGFKAGTGDDYRLKFNMTMRHGNTAWEDIQGKLFVSTLNGTEIISNAVETSSRWRKTWSRRLVQRTQNRVENLPRVSVNTTVTQGGLTHINIATTPLYYTAATRQSEKECLNTMSLTVPNIGS